MDINYLQALIKSDEARKKRDFMLYDFYQNDTEEIKEYLIQYMLGSSIDKVEQWHYENGIPVSEVTEGQGLFSTKTAQIMPKIHRDIVGKTLNNICTSYHTGVDRYLVDGKGKVNRDATDLLNDIYKNAGVNFWQKEWYRLAKLFNIVEVKPVWRKKTERVEFDIWTPNFFTVIENSESYLYKDAVMFDIVITVDGEEVDAKEVWSETEHYYLVYQGSKKIGESEIDIYSKQPIPNNPDMVNPYKDENGNGIIPSQELRFKIGQDYYGEGMFDLVENNIWHDIQESNLTTTIITKGSGGILYAVNMGKVGAISTQPFMINSVNGVSKDLAEPKIESVPMDVSISDLIESAKSNIEQILMTKGLSSQSATTSNQNAPGISKALDQDELEMLKQEDELILTEFEEKLFQIVKIVNNYHSDTKIPDGLDFVCQFNKKKTALSTNDMIAKWKFEFENGLKSKVDYLTEENPSLTTEQAKEQLKEIQDEKLIERDTFAPQDGSSNNGGTGTAPQNPQVGNNQRTN